MTRRLSVTVERFALSAPFTIARGTKTEAAVILCEVEENGRVGRGECVPYARYGETLESVETAIRGLGSAIRSGADRADLAQLLPAGAARNAVDCALWDLEAKLTGTSVAERLGIPHSHPIETAYTISLGSPDDMAAHARDAAGRSVLKVKVGAEGDAERLHAIRAAAPEARLIVDANEGWTDQNIVANMLAAARIGAVLVEQPLPAGKDTILARIPHPVPICADESAHSASDLAALVGRYDYVNLKLDKAGGLTEALAFANEARRLGFGLMVGCMVGTSLAMAPAVLLGQTAEVVDLDGPLLLKADRPLGLTYEGSKVHPPQPELWG